MEQSFAEGTALCPPLPKVQCLVQEHLFLGQLIGGQQTAQGTNGGLKEGHLQVPMDRRHRVTHTNLGYHVEARSHAGREHRNLEVAKGTVKHSFVHRECATV
jgi:hypothetical protein